jgi:hypothetical protein
VGTPDLLLVALGAVITDKQKFQILVLCGGIQAGYIDLARVIIKLLKVRERSYKRIW